LEEELEEGEGVGMEGRREEGGWGRVKVLGGGKRRRLRSKGGGKRENEVRGGEEWRWGGG